MLFAFSSYASIFTLRLRSLIGSLVNLRMLRLHRERIADIATEEREPSDVGTGYRWPAASTFGAFASHTATTHPTSSKTST